MEGSRHRAIFKYHPRWGYWFRENLYARIAGEKAGAHGYTIVTNSVGARTHHPLKSNGVARILFIGCSFTAGDGVDNHRRFTDMLERSNGNVECHNYALSGSGHDQQYLIHEHFAPLLRPEILIVSPYTGCIGRNHGGDRLTYDPLSRSLVLRPKPYFRLIEEGRLELHNSPVPRRTLIHDPAQAFGSQTGVIARRLHRWATLVPLRVAMRHRRGAVFSHYDDPASPSYRLAQAILGRLLGSSEAKVKVIAPLPSWTELRGPPRPHYLGFFEELARDTGAVLLDVRQAFLDVAPAERSELFLPALDHYSESGHHLISAFLCDKIASCLAAFGSR